MRDSAVSYHSISGTGSCMGITDTSEMMALTTFPVIPRRRAVLIFAEEIALDLARRGLPGAARPLFATPSLEGQLPSGTDVHFFTSRHFAAEGAPGIHRQKGNSFAARLENAVAEIGALGYDEVVAVGRDCPSLTATDITLAFAELDSRRLVLGPDHRGGCYLIAFRLIDRHLLRGIRWKQNTDCAQLRDRCPTAKVFLLPVKYDLDSWADVAVFARSADPLSRLADFLLAMVTNVADAIAYFVDLATQHIRIRWQIPPPAFAN